MEQLVMAPDEAMVKQDRVDLSTGLSIAVIKGHRKKAVLYRHGTLIKEADLADKAAKRIFVVEAVELGAKQSHLAKALGISRQTIHNYREIKKHFGLEGLVHGYTLEASKSRRKQREIHQEQRFGGNKAQQVADIRRKQREEAPKQLRFNFSFPEGDASAGMEPGEQPFSEEHGWEFSRYAGVFAYLFPMIGEWKWLQLVMGYFGSKYKIFMAFVLMAAANVRSIEQLKNIRGREAGVVLGLGRLPSRPKIWEWFYRAAREGHSVQMVRDYFRCQIRAGLVATWLWFTDGHLLPYTGKESVRSGYHTQRRMPMPGQTNLVTCDASGRVVDFEIEEGKGDLRARILELGRKWADEVPQGPVMVFDREGHGTEFFSSLIEAGIAFVTWEKHADKNKLSALEEDRFDKHFEFNGKQYSVLEGEKSCSHAKEGSEDRPHSFKLRRIYLWNRTSNRRACGLAWDGDRGMSTEDCARAILSRWGASENGFKHIKERHPLHYHPGFKLVESERQEIANPAVKKQQGLINRLKKALSKLYEKLSKAREVLNKDGSVRRNSVREQLKKQIAEREAELAQLKEKKQLLPDKVEVSSLQDYRSFQRIDNEGKRLFDFVTCSVWNARKQMVDWLLPFFNQDNECVDLFYAITACHGWVKSTADEVIVRLEPLQQPKRRSAQEQLCRKLTSLAVQTPTGKYLTIEVGDSPL